MLLAGCLSSLVFMVGRSEAGHVLCPMPPGSICTCPEDYRVAFPAQSSDHAKKHGSCSLAPASGAEAGVNKDSGASKDVPARYCFLTNPACHGSPYLFYTSHSDTLGIRPPGLKVAPITDSTYLAHEGNIPRKNIPPDPPFHPPRIPFLMT